VEDESPLHARLYQGLHRSRGRSRWSTLRSFLVGVIAGCVAVFAVLWIVASRTLH